MTKRLAYCDDMCCYVFIFCPFRNIGFGWKAEYRLSRCYGALGLLHFPIVLMNRLNKTESAVFLYCWFTLSPNDPFFQII